MDDTGLIIMESLNIYSSVTSEQPVWDCVYGIILLTYIYAYLVKGLLWSCEKQSKGSVRWQKTLINCFFNSDTEFLKKKCFKLRPYM